MKVDFYIIKNDDPDADWLFSAKLIEKAYQLGHQIYVLCDDEDMAIAFDEFLWQFNPDSFIPHHLFNEGPIPPAPVQIGFGDHLPQSKDILVNLSATLPHNHQQFKRICEIVANQDEIKVAKRKNYRDYQSAQYTLSNHEINSI
jgi:DNA polymerase-3 subunit chi